MKDLKWCSKFLVLLIVSFFLTGFIGCDSGKKTVEQVTGKETVDQYQKSKKDINDAVEKQSNKLNSIPDETDEKADEE
jgi:hypothetical protein